MSRIMARYTRASVVSGKASSSFDKRRHLPSQAKVRSGGGLTASALPLSVGFISEPGGAHCRVTLRLAWRPGAQQVRNGAALACGWHIAYN